MYIEVLHDALGAILHCYCADTLPSDPAAALFRLDEGLPEGLEHARINLDTVGAMEIEMVCGLQAVIDPSTLKPSIVDVDRASYIMRKFIVDVAETVAVPSTVLLPPGLMIRRLKRV